MSDLPDNNPKTRFGITKPGVADIPVTAKLHIGLAMRDGKNKYGRANWREKAVTASIYYEAANRHMDAWWDREQNADDSGIHHLGHAAACLAILMDAEHVGNLIDDRPEVPAGFSDLVKALTTPMADAGPGPIPTLRSINEIVSYKTMAPQEFDEVFASERNTDLDAEDRAEAEAMARLEDDNTLLTNSEGEVLAIPDEVVAAMETIFGPGALVRLADYMADPPENDEDEAEEEDPSRVEVTIGMSNSVYDLVARPEVTLEEAHETVTAFLRKDANSRRLAAVSNMKRHLGCMVLGRMDQAQRTALCFYIDAFEAECSLSLDALDGVLARTLGAEQ